MVPPATQIIDNLGATWTIAATGAILRNGDQAAGGWGSAILWKNTTIYVLGTDWNWWQYTGSSWINVGPSQPGGGATQVMDNLSEIWAIGAMGGWRWS